MNDPVAILERFLRHDASVRAAGNIPKPAAESQIIDFIVKYKLYRSETTRQWLIERSSTQNDWIGRRIVESIGSLIESGYPNEAVAMFSSVVGLDDEKAGLQRRQKVFNIHSLLNHEIKKLLKMPGIVRSFPNVWGKRLVQLQSLLLLEEGQKQFKRWGKNTETSKTKGPDYDNHFHHRYYQRERSERDAWGIIAQAIERGLTEAVTLPENGSFCILADQLVASEWGLAICQPLVALYDHIKTHVKRSWQHTEAIRLLSVVEVEERYVAFAWRRLLRRLLLPMLNKEEIKGLLIRIRESQSNDRLLTNELADFDEYSVLSDDEKIEIDKARVKGELFEPTDPRELVSITQRVSFSGETPTDQFIRTWTHSEDHALLRILIDAKKVDFNTTIDDIEASLFPRLDALKSVMKRKEIDSPDWMGQIFNWCASAIGDMKLWFRNKNRIPKNEEINVFQYLEILDERAPWWENRIAAALERLKQPPPEGHNSYQSDLISWGSNDPIACSFIYLDEVLAAPIGSKLDTYRFDLAESIVAAWDDWPSYTHGLAISILRTYYWAKNKNLTELLIRVLKTATHSQDVEFSLQHLLRLGQPGISDLMRSLINRIDTLTNSSEIAYLIGEVIGNAVVRYRGDGEDIKVLADITELYDELSADRSKGKLVRFSLIASIMMGARSHLCSKERLERTHAELWLSIVTCGLNDWLEMGDDQKNDLPVSPITDVREIRWDNDQQIFLLEGMADILMRIINKANLGGFYEIHYELKKLLKDDRSEQNLVLNRAVRFSLDHVLIAFCRASAIRVAQWRKEGRITNDIAYTFSLSGDNTSELIILVFESATDREYARRQLAPVIDILADAGLRDMSSQLRQKLRYS